jgi:amino-acid N-acetyltransferase
MNELTEYKIIPANDGFKQKVIELLQESDLPVSDLDEQKDLFALLQNNEVAGTGGLEFFNSCALLCSVSVRKDLQGQGLGKFINQELEKISRQRGIDCLYLLTTTAKDFFNKEGYEVISRDDVPESIKGTSEFSSVCPSSAIVMRKNLV